MCGVLPYCNTSGPADSEVVKDISTFPERSPIAQVLATCHTLTCIENRLCGDPLDITMFTATGWVSKFFVLKFNNIDYIYNFLSML